MAENENQSKAHRKAYTAATARLRDEHREEFNKFMAEEAKALGFEWSPRPTAEDKAQAEFERLIAEYPHLAERVQVEQSAE